MIKKVSRNELRKQRHYRVRAKVTGTAERPRLNVFRSSKHIYAQIIDDVTVEPLSNIDFFPSGIPKRFSFTSLFPTYL